MDGNVCSAQFLTHIKVIASEFLPEDSMISRYSDEPHIADFETFREKNLLRILVNYDFL